MKWVRLDEDTGEVIEISPLTNQHDLNECYHPDIAKLFVEAPDTIDNYHQWARVNGEWVITRHFEEPLPEHAPELAAEEPKPVV